MSARTMRTTARPMRMSVARPLSTNSKTKTDQYPDDKHAVDKTKEGDTYNIRESNTKDAMDAADKGKGGTATSGSDTAGAVNKAKKDFPAAPDPAIGMQDERGGKGY
ncbi:hypothetical protein T440DRAFT_517249 [Plenodomus tracheiphilus IPT5]|uniref:Uncharacterized protein n=1 Tax=Plenodomus tracheiphilus IPT5 TaxID=1408161 RepID=A0A6A7BBQ0_9PLEO|nr:hypothetical protein T440DRAFT_517249 [Plenodomus tracheiphilus IPT5]